MLSTSSPPATADAIVIATALYDRDYALWIETTIAQLRSKNVTEIDWENVLEEFEDMGKRERRSLKSNLVILLQHLLKWEFQPEKRSGSWKASIREHRQRLRDRFEESPSLRNYLRTALSSAYIDAVERAADETGLSIEAFPIDCPYEFEEILDAAFLPE
jgi:Domain of unknown function DUF29